MLDVKYIQQNKDEVQANFKKRGLDIDLDSFLDLDQKRRELIQKTEEMKAELNKISKSKPDEKTIQQAKELKSQIKENDNRLQEVEEEFNKSLFLMPNLLLDTVPEGKSEEDNQVLREEGKKPNFDFKIKDYLALAEAKDLIDTTRAAKVAGARFGYIKKELALMEFALVNLAFQNLTKKGFKAVVPPVMLKPEAMKAMGYLDRHDDEIYHLSEDDLYLVGTSEQSVGAMHMKEALNQADLPLRYVAFSTCFRREAGSYGKDTKGILRVHQFDKVEMFSFCHPDESVKEHDFLLSCQEDLMQQLQLPYRVVNLCSADLGYPSAQTYDIETWLPGQDTYRETHSTSNCTDFQARRLNIRFKDKDNKTNFIHTLNGTAFAIGRILIAIIENYQQADGSILVPEALKPYLPFEKIE